MPAPQRRVQHRLRRMVLVGIPAVVLTAVGAYVTAPASALETPSQIAVAEATPSTPATPSAPATPSTPAAAAEPFKGVANSECADLDRLGVSWFYNWGTGAGDCTGHGFVPMVHGRSEKTAAAVTAAIDQIGQSGYDTVLGFNEPNKSDQANLTVEQAVSLWPAMTANAQIKVGSPATSADTAGQAWFSEFMAQVEANNLRVDFITAHWYGWNAGSCAANAAEFENYLAWVESKAGGRPIWITEFGCLNLSNPDEATVQAFFEGAVAMFDRHPLIARHAWYPWITNNHLVAEDGSLTSLGTAYANAPSLR